MVDPRGYDVTKAELGYGRVGFGDSQGKPTEMITQYRFTLLRQINGIDFVNAGIRIAIHRSGGIASIRLGGAEVVSTRNGSLEMPGAGGYSFQRVVMDEQIAGDFAKAYPNAVGVTVRTAYVLPDEKNQAIVEPLRVFSFATQNGESVSRRRMIGYSLRFANQPIDFGPKPDPNAVGDPR